MAIAATLIVSASQAHAWTTSVTIASEADPTSRSLSIDTQKADQALLPDGTSIAVWRSFSGGESRLLARTLDRTGTTLGPDTVVAAVPDPALTLDWTVTSLGDDGFLISWVETSSTPGTERMDLKFRTMSATGVLGAINQLDSTEVPTAEGISRLEGVASSSGGGFASLSWSLLDRRGPVASDCNVGFFEETSGPCDLTQKARFAQIGPDGTVVVQPSDLISRSFTSENTNCFFGGLAFSAIGQTVLSYPSSRAATVVIEDYCRPQGGELTWTNLYARVSAGGQISQPDFLSFGPLDSKSISSDGTAVLTDYERLYRIPPRGSVPEPIIGVTKLSREWSVGGGRAIALPSNQAIVIWQSSRISGNDLEKAVWGRLIQADGTLGKPQQLLSRTITSADPGTSRDFFLSPVAAVGLGRETGTVLVSIEDWNRQSSTSRSDSVEFVAFALNRNGGKVAGSESVLESRSISWPPATEGGFISEVLDLDVAKDGTASALVFTDVDKFELTPPFPGSADARMITSKLLRNPNTCGVTPSLCKAKLKVAALKLAKSGGSKAKLTITLKNAGNKDASKVKAKLSATGGAKVPKTVSFSKVLEGKTAKKTVTITLGSGSGSIKVKAGKSSKTARF